MVTGPGLAGPRSESGRAEFPSQGSGSPCWTLESRLLNALGGLRVGARNMLCGCALKALAGCPDEASGDPRGPLGGSEKVDSV